MEHKREKYERLIAFAKTLPPLPTAVAHPCDHDSLSSVIEAARLHLIAPILVGPRVKIEAAAREGNLDLADLPIVDVPHSHAAADMAVQLVHEGKREALMKGSLHTDELMAAVVARGTGLRTERRVSHCFVMDVPGHDDPLIITDAAVNISPTLDEKRDIVQNAIDLAHALRFPDCAGRDSVGDGNRQLQSALDARCRRAVQDGRSPADHRRHSRRPARAR